MGPIHVHNRSKICGRNPGVWPQYVWIFLMGVGEHGLRQWICWRFLEQDPSTNYSAAKRHFILVWQWNVCDKYSSKIFWTATQIGFHRFSGSMCPHKVTEATTCYYETRLLQRNHTGECRSPGFTTSCWAVVMCHRQESDIVSGFLSLTTSHKTLS